jgi:hypothetical protein
MKRLIAIAALLVALSVTCVGCLDLPGNPVCKVTFPNGNVLATLANGETWITVKKFDGFRFVIAGMGNVTGPFWTKIITKLPESDIIQAPQAEMMWRQVTGRSGAMSRPHALVHETFQEPIDLNCGNKVTIWIRAWAMIHHVT